MNFANSSAVPLVSYSTVVWHFFSRIRSYLSVFVFPASPYQGKVPFKKYKRM